MQTEAESLTDAARDQPGEAVEEASLLSRLARSDPSVLDDIVTAYRGRISRLVYRLLGWDDDAEDVVQDVFLAAIKSLKSFRGQSSLATWLMAIAVNRCRTYRRRRLLRMRSLRRLFAQGPVRTSKPPDDAPLRRETFDQVQKAMRSLPVRLREVAVLRYLEEMPIDEIAQVLGISRNAVEVRGHRARNRLKKMLRGHIEEQYQ